MLVLSIFNQVQSMTFILSLKKQSALGFEWCGNQIISGIARMFTNMVDGEGGEFSSESD